MIQNLYLILYAIAALGVIGLVLIFSGYDRRARKKIQPAELQELEDWNDEKDQDQHAGLSEAIIPRKSTEVISAASDIAMLGFSAVDVLLTEAKNFSTPAAYNALTQNAEQNPDLIILYVMAPPHCQFVGYELLQALLAAELRYGEMGIFHRYADTAEQKDVWFSVASAVEPGVFDLANIGAYSCEGLSLFMSISNSENPITVFELMLETARQLVDDLAGELCDGMREPLSVATLEEYQARVRP